MAREARPPKLVVLSDGLHKFELELQDGAHGFTEGASSASTLGAAAGGGRFGDFEPNFAHIEQRTWNGGRGSENFVDDQTRFFDSRQAWTLTPNKLFPAPQASFAKGLRNVDEYDIRPRNVTWVPLFLYSVNVAVPFVASASYNADKVNLWIRRRGSPGTLTLTLKADGGGAPGSTLKTVTKTTIDIPDTVSEFITFDWTTTQALTSGTTYWIVVTGAASDGPASHWEIGVDAGNTGGYYADSGLIYAPAAWIPYYRISDVDIARHWIMFELEGGVYACSVNDDVSASVVYINGDRGTASAGATTSLTNSARSWVTNQWAGARVKIIGGTGKGMNTDIASNNGTVLTFGTALPYALDNTSRYVIYQTPYWTTASIGTTGLGAVKSIAVMNGIAYFAQGQSVNIRRAQSSANTHNWADDGTNKADLIYPFYDASDGPQVCIGNNGTTISFQRANATAWGVNLTFRTAIPIGRADYLITNITDYNNQLYLFKEDSIWSLVNDRAARVNIGIEGLPDGRNGEAAASNGMFLFFSFWKSMERLYGGTIDDVGPWHDSGLPNARVGKVAYLRPLLAWLFAGIDAGTSGASSVMIFQDRGWHEVYRAWDVGKRVRSLFSHNQDDVNPFLWIDVGGELVYQEYSLNPLKDDNFAFHHEAVLESSTIDMGHTHTYKYIEEVETDTENLDRAGITIGLDYQAGNLVNTDTWIPTNGLLSSPKDVAKITIGEVSKVRFRLRLITDFGTIPPIMNATVLKGFEVLPVKRVWNLRIKVSSILSGSRRVDPDVLYLWLWNASMKAAKVRMYTAFPNINDVNVKLEPPTTTWAFINRAAKWTGVFYLTLREL